MLPLGNMGKRKAPELGANLNPTVKLTRSRFNTTTTNRFSILATDNGEPSSDMEPKKKPAPITVTDVNQYKRLDEIVKSLNVKYRYKFIGIGIKVFMNTDEDRQKVESKLIEGNVEFYSHPTQREKVFKIVLAGLPDISTDELKKSLVNENNLNPLKIIKLETKGYNKLYLLHLNKNDISKNDIKDINVVYNHIIQWRPFRSKKRGPTQCFKCGMYGHGMSFCHRQTSCFLCSKNHETKSCPLSSNNNENTQAIFRCMNCARHGLPAAHRANDHQCPARGKYITAKTNKNPHNTMSQKNKSMTQLINTEATPLFQIAPTPPIMTKSYATAVRSSINSSTNNRTNFDNNCQNNLNNSETLWSFEEVTNILLTSINELSQCKTKFDQLRVITNILQNVCK